MTSLFRWSAGIALGLSLLLTGVNLYPRSVAPIEKKTTVVYLTPREKQVFALMAKGRTNKEIASELGIQLGTVQGYRLHIKDKMGFKTQAELARFAHDGKG